MIPGTFVAGLNTRWDDLRQRPQHLLVRIAGVATVIVVEPPFASAEDDDDVRLDGAVTVIRPLRRRADSLPHVDAQTVATARSYAGDGPAGVWLWTPLMLPLADAFGAQPLVYDSTDVAAGDAGTRAAARADLVFTAGRALFETYAGFGEKVRCEPDGVDFERFAADVAPHPLPGELRGPVFGYAGTIDERIDAGLIATLADVFPDGHVVMVGPVAPHAGPRLPRRPNVHLTGAVPYDALPSWLAAFDVALIPFAHRREAAAPVELLEYFAAGTPVVSTPSLDIAAEFPDAAVIADGTDAFVAAVGGALRPAPERIARGRSYAREREWDAVAERMLDAVAAL